MNRRTLCKLVILMLMGVIGAMEVGCGGLEASGAYRRYRGNPSGIRGP